MTTKRVQRRDNDGHTIGQAIGLFNRQIYKIHIAHIIYILPPILRGEDGQGTGRQAQNKGGVKGEQPQQGDAVCR